MTRIRFDGLAARRLSASNEAPRVELMTMVGNPARLGKRLVAQDGVECTGFRTGDEAFPA